MPIERVDRPGESQEATGGKKSEVHIRCCLNPVEVSFLSFGFVWWLDCLLLKKAHQPFAALGDCLRCFLVLRSLRDFAQVAGFHLDNCIEYFTAPCWPPLPPSRLLPKFSARTEDES